MLIEGAWSLKVFATKKSLKLHASEIAGLQKEISALDTSVKVSFIEQDIQALETDILRLQRIERSGQAHASEINALDEKTMLHESKIRQLRSIRSGTD